jgi:hypothetical protein
MILKIMVSSVKRNTHVFFLLIEDKFNSYTNDNVLGFDESICPYSFSYPTFFLKNVRGNTGIYFLGLISGIIQLSG